MHREYRVPYLGTKAGECVNRASFCDVLNDKKFQRVERSNFNAYKTRNDFQSAKFGIELDPKAGITMRERTNKKGDI